jgi:hypothetical protein
MPDLAMLHQIFPRVGQVLRWARLDQPDAGRAQSILIALRRLQRGCDHLFDGARRLLSPSCLPLLQSNPNLKRLSKLNSLRVTEGC